MPSEQIVLTYSSEDVSMYEIEDMLRQRVVERKDKGRSTIVLEPQVSKISRNNIGKTTLSTYKKNTGQKPLRVPIFSIAN